MPIRIRRPAGDVTSSPNADNSSFLTRMGGLRGLLGTGVRIGAGVLASPGGLFGAGVGALGETGAELVEGSKPNPARVGVEAGLAAVPLSSVFKLGRMGESALRSGAMSAAGTAGRELAQGESLNPRAIAEAGASGGLLGGLFSKLGGGAPKVGKKAPEPFYEVEQTAQKGGQTLGPGGSGIRSTQPIQRIKGNGMPSMRGENPGLAGLGAESSEDFYPSVSVGGPSEGPIYRSATKQALARDAEEFLQDEVKPAEAQAKLNDKEAKNRTKLDLVNQLLSGKTRGAVTGGESIAAETEGGLTRRASIRFKKQAGAKAPSEAPKKVTRAQQLGGIEPAKSRLPAADATQEVGARVDSSGAAARIAESDAGTKALEELEALTGGSGIRTVAGRGTMPAADPLNLERSTDGYGESINGGVDVTPANLIRDAHSEQRSLQGGAQAAYGSVEDGLEGFGPSGVPPTGLARFFGVQEPLGSPRKPKAPSLKAQAQAESERMLKQKMADEATPRPSEWDQYPPEVAQELDRLGLLYRSAPEGLEKRGLGAQLSELKMFMSGKKKDGTPYMRDSWKGTAPPAAEVPATAPPPAAPEAPDWVKEQSSLVDQLKDLYKNQKGAVSNELGMRLGLGLGGAAIGAAADPLGDRYESGLAGFSAGIVAPSVVQGLPGILKALGSAPDAIQEIQQRAAQEGPRQTAQRIIETFPQYQRFNMLLTGHGLASNAIVGPWGSAMTGAIEAGLTGDPRGWRLAKSMLTPEAFQKAPEAWEEAVRLIEQGDIGRAETIFGTSLPAKIFMLPGTAMTAGDEAARHMIREAGFPEDTARSMTMTGEPEFKSFQKIANLTKDAPALSIVMPFTRTLANLGEQGLMRAPILGSFVQLLRDPAVKDDWKKQIVQQGMSVGIGGANYFLGQQLDPDTAKIVRRYASNIAGRYGLAASVGFAAGQASQKGQDVLSTAGVHGIQEALPLPTTDIPESYVRQLSNFLHNKPVTPPTGLMPRDVQDKLFPPQQTSAPRAPRIRIRRP